MEPNAARPPPTATDDSDRGLRIDLEDEVRIDGLPVEGECRPGSRARCCAPAREVGRSASSRCATGSTASRCCTASASATARSPTPIASCEARPTGAAQETGEIDYSEFATDPCRSLFKRVIVDVRPEALRQRQRQPGQARRALIAMTETPIPVQFDAETLEAAGVAYERPGDADHRPSASRPRRAAGCSTTPPSSAPRNEYRFFHLAPDAEEPEVDRSLPVEQPAYMHSFGLTERWLVLAEFPFVVNPMRSRSRGRPYIENYEWKPERGTRFTLSTARRRGDRPVRDRRLLRLPPRQRLRGRDGTVVADICAFEDASMVEDLYLDRLRAGKPVAEPELRRFRISTRAPARSTARAPRRRADRPAADQLRALQRAPLPLRLGRRRRRAAAGSTGSSAPTSDGGERAWAEAGCYPGEPVFVAAPGDGGEDDGVLLSVVLDGRGGTSFLLVPRTRRPTEIAARPTSPHHIPFGFHWPVRAGLRRRGRG